MSSHTLGSGGGGGSGREAELATGTRAAAPQIPEPASTLGAASSSSSQSSLMPHLLSRGRLYTSTPDTSDFWSSSATSQLSSNPSPRTDIGLRGFGAHGLTKGIPRSATHSGTSEGADADSNLDTDNPRISIEPPTPNSTPQGLVQESTQPSMPDFLRVSVPPTPIPSNTPEVPIRGFALPSVPNSYRGSFLVIPTPSNTPRVPLQGSIQQSRTSFPWAYKESSVRLSNSISSTLGYPTSSVSSSLRSSTLLSSSQTSVQESSPPAVLSSPLSMVQEFVTLYGSSRGSVQESAPSLVPDFLQGSVQRPLMPTDSSQVSAKGSIQPSVLGNSQLLIKGLAPPPDSSRVSSVQGTAPPSVPGSSRLSVEESAPPPDSPQESVEESASPLSRHSLIPTPGTVVKHIMASLEKASVEGHMFEVVVIGGGISGQCEP